MNQPMIAPSVMCMPHWTDISASLRLMRDDGVSLLHADIMDGSFVPNLMLGTVEVEELRKISPLPLDLHFMVTDPEQKIPWFDIQPGEYVSVHAESTRHLQRVLASVLKRICAA